LTAARSQDFQHKYNCTCHGSPISHEMQICGNAPWKLRDCGILPRCPYSILDDDEGQSDLVAMRNILSYIITLDVESTKKRIDEFLPSSVFRGQAMQGIRAKLGIAGYRKSVHKALLMGLGKKDASLIALFDYDFRVSKYFEETWTLMTEPTSTCYHHTLSNGGFFLLRTTVQTENYWRHILTHPRQYLYGSTEISRCTDGSPFMRGSFATIFSRKGAELAVKWLERTPDDRPFDWFWMDFMEELGYPVLRGAIYPLFVADVNKTSGVDPTRHRMGTVQDMYTRHILHRWGNVSGYLP
jgi:hypothetical protein